MPNTEDDDKIRLESEKARAIVWFAVLAIIATVRVTVHEADLWNFPCNSPCPHLSLYAASVLTNWIYLWLGYGGCMIVYFSEDWLQKYGEQGRALREVMRRIGNRVFLFFYPLTLVWFSATAEGSFLIPGWIQGYYWLAVALPWGFVVIWTIEGVLGQKIARKNGILSEAIDLFFKLGAKGAAPFGEALAGAAKRFWSRVKRRPAGPVTSRSVKLAGRLFLATLIIVDLAVVWLLVGPIYSVLIEVLGTTLYILVFVFVFIGMIGRKDRVTKDES